MTQLRTPKFWLLTTAALLFGAQMPAQAQVSPTYQSGYDYGAPQMIAAAPSLPAIPAEQIAQDVQAEFNPRTGQTEYAAQPFDPFEDDPHLAGALTLRSGDGGVAINGQPLQGGALVDVDFYYNSPSDDPYDGRNYSDVSFVNGQLAPVVLRDSRILECSTRVDNVIYDQVNYYDQSASLSGLYRPTRFYSGHSAFGFGFGSGYFGPGISYYNRNRNNFSRIRAFDNARNRRSDIREARRDRVRDRDRSERRDRRNARAETEDARPVARRGLTAQQEQNRLRAMQLHGSALGFSGGVQNRGRSTLRSAAPGDRIVIAPIVSPAQSQSQSATSTAARQQLRSAGTQESRTARAARRAASERSSEPRIADTSASARQTPESRAVRTQRSLNRITSSRGTPVRSSATPAQPAVSRSSSTKKAVSGTIKSRASGAKTTKSRSSSSKKSSSSKSTARSENTNSRSSSSGSRKSRSSRSKTNTRSRSSSSRSAPSRSSSIRNRTNRKLNFFPPNSAGGRHVVTNHSVDCAREDKLRVFVSNERLDAARFDGLTLIALDQQGGETPIYIPPNYIEGFRLAVSGSVHSPVYSSQQPSIRSAPPQRRLELAPCPSGTSPQTDGTCLQNGSLGYQNR